MALAAAFARQKAGKLCVVCKRSIPADKFLRHVDSCRISVNDDDCQVIESSSSSSVSSTSTTSRPTRRRSKENLLLTKCASSPGSVTTTVIGKNYFCSIVVIFVIFVSVCRMNETAILVICHIFIIFVYRARIGRVPSSSAPDDGAIGAEN